MHDIKYRNFGGNTAIEIWMHMFNPQLFLDIADSSDQKRCDLLDEKRREHRENQRNTSSAGSHQPFVPPDSIKYDILPQDIFNLFAFTLYTMIDQKTRISLYFSRDFQTPLCSSFFPTKRSYYRVRFVPCPPTNSILFDMDSFLNLLKTFLQMRCIDGYDSQVGIQVTESNKPLSENSAGVCYSALKWYFDVNGHFGNNPMELPCFGVYFKGFKEIINNNIKKKNHSRPLNYFDMICLTFSEISCFNNLGNNWFKAIATTAYLCFFRMDEILSVQMKDLKLKYDMDNLPYYELTISDRKVELEEPKIFMIYDNCLEPAINAFYFLTRYIDAIKSMNVLHLNDLYLFGSYKNDKIHFQTQIKSSNFNRLLKQAMIACDLDPHDVSTHTFRRGGARHRLMYGQFTWSLDIICTWASWSGDSSVLQRYLIDTLKDKQLIESMQALKHQTPNASYYEMHKKEMAHLQHIGNEISKIINIPQPPSKQIQSKFQMFIKPAVHTATLPIDFTCSAIARLIKHVDCKTVKDVVVSWTIGYPDRNIPPLKEWNKHDKALVSSQRKLYRNKRNIGLVYDYYQSHKNEVEFWSKYNCTITAAKILAKKEKRELGNN